MVYPIDLVKTRMQNQRVAAVGQQLYNNNNNNNNNSVGGFCEFMQPVYISHRILAVYWQSGCGIRQPHGVA